MHRLGDCENDEALNRKVSPLFHVDKIRAPLLIGQGANDPRVKQSESDQIAEALEEKKIDYEYVVYTDEGHGFARPENRLDFNGRMEEVWQYCGSAYPERRLKVCCCTSSQPSSICFSD